jgi:hypothetical protein
VWAFYLEIIQDKAEQLLSGVPGGVDGFEIARHGQFVVMLP